MSHDFLRKVKSESETLKKMAWMLFFQNNSLPC